MKTSKIIFITLLGTIAFLILAAMIDIRINGRKGGINRDDIRVHKNTLHTFRVLYINNSRNITVIQNDSSFIEVAYLKDSIVPKVNYSIKGDTMMVSDYKNIGSVTISFPSDSPELFKRILLKKSDMSIRNVRSGKLSLNLDQSTVWMNQFEGEKYSLSILDVVAKNHSHFNTDDFKVDSLGIVLQNSKSDIRVYAKKISGSLSDSSRIYARQPLEISLKKDATSKISVNDY
jgi:hypothetical protein